MQAICPWWRSERYGRHIPETRLLEAVWFYETSNKVQNKWIERSRSKLGPPKKSLIDLHVNLFIYWILHNVLSLTLIVVSVWTSVTVRYNLYHTANDAGLDNLFFFPIQTSNRTHCFCFFSPPTAGNIFVFRVMQSETSLRCNQYSLLSI